MLIEEYLPVYHFREVHSIEIRTATDNVYGKMLGCDFSKSFLIRSLFRLRGMSTKLCSIQDLPQMGFIKLDETPGKEILFGVITHSPMFNGCQSNLSPFEFTKTSEGSVNKAVINFRVVDNGLSNYIISTETRVWCGSNRMKSRFKIYWFFVSPFSRLIRKSMLSQVKLYLS